MPALFVVVPLHSLCCLHTLVTFAVTFEESPSLILQGTSPCLVACLVARRLRNQTTRFTRTLTYR